jgi:bifunctional UDP-N-acetylglucosamine pyrophosphorylase/glucosamine-1-phosphate N-acetyltransferase
LEISDSGEYYLTDLISMAVSEGGAVGSVTVSDPEEGIGINNRVHLSEAEAIVRKRINREWMARGVTMQDPDATYISPEVELGRDVHIMANTHLEGATRVGSGTRIGPNTVIRGCTIGSGCSLVSSFAQGAVLEDDVSVGPFARLREGALLRAGSYVGNFGEVKNSTLGSGAKAGHFCYIGDADIGPGVNIGAGTITANYDGEKKHKTVIDQDAFIGSDTMLVAPVKIGRGARTGAGSVVTRDVPDYSVAVGVPARVIRKLEQDHE